MPFSGNLLLRPTGASVTEHHQGPRLASVSNNALSLNGRSKNGNYGRDVWKSCAHCDVDSSSNGFVLGRPQHRSRAWSARTSSTYLLCHALLSPAARHPSGSCPNWCSAAHAACNSLRGRLWTDPAVARLSAGRSSSAAVHLRQRYPRSGLSLQIQGLRTAFKRAGYTHGSPCTSAYGDNPCWPCSKW